MPFRKSKPWGSVKPPAGSLLSRAHPLAAGLRGRYLFNEGGGAIGADLARLNHAAITAPGWLPGKFGKTLSLNGSTSYAKLGSVVQTQTNFTVAFWVYERTRVTNDGDPAAAHVLFTINDGGSFNEFSSSNGVIFYVTTGNAWASTAITVPLATWTHLVFSMQGNTLNLYVNGVFAVQKTNAQNDGRLFPIILGGWQDNSANAPSKGFMDGLFDSVSVFDRAVGATEALALFSEPFADICAPRRRIISRAAASGVTGTVASTDRRDTSSASGTVKVTGTVASSDVRDTSSASGIVKVTGSAASADTRDAASASGLVKVTGTAASADTRDTSSASGLVKVTGTAAGTDVRDTSSAAGLVKVTGSVASSDRRDAAAASGTITITGAAAATDRRDGCSAAGTVEVVAGAGLYFEADLFSHLTADASVLAAAGTRIYPVVMPQEETLPSAVYQVITLDELGNLAGQAGDVEHYRLQVDCWAMSDAAADRLADAVRSRMRTAAENFRAVLLPSAFEDFEPETRRYRRMLEFSVWYDVP